MHGWRYCNCIVSKGHISQFSLYPCKSVPSVAPQFAAGKSFRVSFVAIRGQPFLPQAILAGKKKLPWKTRTALYNFIQPLLGTLCGRGNFKFQFGGYGSEHIITIRGNQEGFFAQYVSIAFFFRYQFNGIVSFTIKRSQDLILF